MSSRRAHLVAGTAALGVFLVLVFAIRLRNWLPFVAAALTYLALLWVWPPRTARPAALPPGIDRDAYAAAIKGLAAAARDLDRLARAAPAADAPTIRRMARLVEAIRRHHEANPGHVPRTRTFVRHALPRMVAAVAGYVDLADRAGPAETERLAGVARQISGFVPALENIDRACVENDLTALEINVEVLNEQLGRDRDL